MRYLFIAASLACLGGLAIVSQAQGRKEVSTTATSRYDGRTRVDFANQCMSGSWNVVVSSNAIRRNLKIYGVVANTDKICLSSIVTGTCDTNTIGAEISTLTPMIEDFGTAAWNCKTYNGTQYLKGYYYQDNADAGFNVQNSPLQ